MKLLLLAGLLGIAGMMAASTHGAFQLVSRDFANGGTIPVSHEGNDFGCTGRNVPPTLSWMHPPPHVAGFALTMIDPDAPTPGGFVHWIVYNISASRRSIGPTTLWGTRQGKNDAGISRYFGPCPPVGSGPHHYHFTLYALSLRNLTGKHLTITALRRQLKGHVVAQATLVGILERR